MLQIILYLLSPICCAYDVLCGSSHLPCRCFNKQDCALGYVVFTLHRDFLRACLNNMVTTVESTPRGKVRYSRELLTFANFRSTKPVPDDIYRYIESNVEPIRRRGRRGGVQRRLRGNKDRLSLPSILLSNVRSINPDG